MKLYKTYKRNYIIRHLGCPARARCALACRSACCAAASAAAAVAAAALTISDAN